MKKKKHRIYELFVPKGYELEDLYDTDDSEFAGAEPRSLLQMKQEKRLLLTCLRKNQINRPVGRNGKSILILAGFIQCVCKKSN